MNKDQFIVSDSQDRLELSGEESLSLYDTAEDAAKAITDGWHGEYGSKYILKIKVELVATATRPWAIIKMGD